MFKSIHVIKVYSTMHQGIFYDEAEIFKIIIIASLKMYKTKQKHECILYRFKMSF